MRRVRACRTKLPQGDEHRAGYRVMLFIPSASSSTARRNSTSACARRSSQCNSIPALAASQVLLHKHFHVHPGHSILAGACGLSRGLQILVEVVEPVSVCATLGCQQRAVLVDPQGGGMAARQDGWGTCAWGGVLPPQSRYTDHGSGATHSARSAVVNIISHTALSSIRPPLDACSNDSLSAFLRASGKSNWS